MHGGKQACIHTYMQRRAACREAGRKVGRKEGSHAGREASKHSCRDYSRTIVGRMSIDREPVRIARIVREYVP